MSVDRTLLDALQVDELTLARLRKLFKAGYAALTIKQRQELAEAGLGARLALLHREMGLTLTDATFALWLRYVEYTERDLSEMELGLYPVCLYLVDQYCDLFRIDRWYLAAGGDPYDGSNLRGPATRLQRHRPSQRRKAHLR